MRVLPLFAILPLVNTFTLVKPSTNVRTRLIPNNKNLIFVTPNNNDEDDEKNEDKFDLVEKYASFVGFEKEEKWKAVRYTVYYYAGFSLLGELYNKWLENANNPFN